MIHLQIKLLGYINTAYPHWPVQSEPGINDEQLRTLGVSDAFIQQHATEPVLQIQITKTEWDEMFDLYEQHVKGMSHPAVRDAWQQYLVARRLTEIKNDKP